MFEDSTFASTGRIRTRTRAGFVAATILDTAVVVALVLVPLLYPHMLPSVFNSLLMSIPAPPVEQPKPPTHTAAKLRPAVLMIDPFAAPRKIPTTTDYTGNGPEPRGISSVMDFFDNSGLPDTNTFDSSARVSVKKADQRPVRVTGLVVEGLLVQKTVPRYPSIAVATHTQGTVVLAATISRTGTIENLHVLSGSPMLLQAALDAVSTWRYRPYMLNGEPVEVETTVNVIFKLGE